MLLIMYITHVYMFIFLLNFNQFFYHFSSYIFYNQLIYIEIIYIIHNTL